MENTIITPAEEYINFVTKTFDELKEQFLAKNCQYGDADPLQNFRRGAQIRYNNDDYNSMFKAALDYECKHIAHVYNNDAHGNKVDESLKDIAIYSIIELYLHSKANHLPPKLTDKDIFDFRMEQY